MPEDITVSTTVGDIEEIPAFEGFGRLLFPVDRAVSRAASLEDLAADGTFVWYTNLRADVFVSALNQLKNEAENENQIFYQDLPRVLPLQASKAVSGR